MMSVHGEEMMFVRAAKVFASPRNGSSLLQVRQSRRTGTERFAPTYHECIRVSGLGQALTRRGRRVGHDELCVLVKEVTIYKVQTGVGGVVRGRVLNGRTV